MHIVKSIGIADPGTPGGAYRVRCITTFQEPARYHRLAEQHFLEKFPQIGEEALALAPRLSDRASIVGEALASEFSFRRHGVLLKEALSLTAAASAIPPRAPDHAIDDVCIWVERQP